MGNNCGTCLSATRGEKVGDTSLSLTKNSFIFSYVIGTGGYGKVWRVENKLTKTVVALKVLSKAKILAKQSIQSIMNERNILAQIGNPFIANMRHAFQDQFSLYLVMDFMKGGDLRYHLHHCKRMSEEEIKFCIACLIIALEFLHAKYFIHRDIKPENCVFDEKGYLHLTDFGIARELKEANSNDTSGTPGYMAPEIILQENHSFPADFFALGVIAYEMAEGERPYLGRMRKQYKDQVQSTQAVFKPNPKNGVYSKEMIDFVNKLIERKPEMRLGANGISELRDHPWMSSIKWNELRKKNLESPLKLGEVDYRKCVSTEDQTSDKMYKPFRKLLNTKKNEHQSKFDGYEYNLDPIVEIKNEFLENKDKHRKSKLENKELDPQIEKEKENEERKFDNNIPKLKLPLNFDENESLKTDNQEKNFKEVAL